MIKHESNKKYNGFSHVGSKEIIVFSKVKVIYFSIYRPSQSGKIL
jgi:hypothetical protein